MKAYRTNEEQMNGALKAINLKYGNNIKWQRFERKGNVILFRLRVIDSRGPGHSLQGYKLTKRSSRACWHVHGDFFDNLFRINPDAYVVSRGGKVTQTEGNWIDRNIGSILNPVYHSECCECE